MEMTDDDYLISPLIWACKSQLVLKVYVRLSIALTSI